MPIFANQSKDLVYDLINESNPDLPVAASPSTMNLNTPTAITPSGGKIQNTKMILNAPANSPFMGRQEITYRRIDLSNLFRSVIVQINKYSAAAAAGNQNTVAYTLYQLLGDLNTKYGMSFTQDDLNDVNITRGNTQNSDGYYYNTVTVSAKATSLAFVGSFTFRWVQAPQDISLMITQTELGGRAFPGGNVFDETHLAVLNSWHYAIDHTDKVFELATNWNKAAFAKTLVASNTTLTAFYKWLIDEMNADLGAELVWDGTFYNVWSHTCYALPGSLASVPEANARYANRVLVLEPPAEGSKGVIGKIFIHFNA